MDIHNRGLCSKGYLLVAFLAAFSVTTWVLTPGTTSSDRVEIVYPRSMLRSGTIVAINQTRIVGPTRLTLELQRTVLQMQGVVSVRIRGTQIWFTVVIYNDEDSNFLNAILRANITDPGGMVQVEYNRTMQLLSHSVIYIPLGFDIPDDGRVGDWKADFAILLNGTPIDATNTSFLIVESFLDAYLKLFFKSWAIIGGIGLLVSACLNILIRAISDFLRRKTRTLALYHLAFFLISIAFVNYCITLYIVAAS